ncbi:MAG: RNA polymerase sigma factor RpoH [Candidatus Competibacteraceae bacterium]|nr:MAG: RNA polymerase sigma factor RpoH [Candidatus Competibacteraceae bacterium]
MTTNALVLRLQNLPVPVDSLDSYIQAVNRMPMLSVEEEQELAQRLRLRDDLDAAQRLIMAHLRFVVHIARGYVGYGLPLGDLIQEGNVGLMKAVKRFDPAHGVRLVSFAVHWIRAEIHEFILRNWRIVKVATTKAQRKLFFKLRGAKKRLGWLNGEEVNTVARELGVSPEHVLEMESRLSGHDISFDPAPETEGEDESETYAPSAYLRDEQDNPAEALEQADWEEQTTSRLSEAMARLDPRSRDIVQRRWLNDDKPTLHDLAAEYHISAERIRQLESNAMKKLRACLPVPA